jgi:hypothetical protein
MPTWHLAILSPWLLDKARFMEWGKAWDLSPMGPWDNSSIIGNVKVHKSKLFTTSMFGWPNIVSLHVEVKLQQWRLGYIYIHIDTYIHYKQDALTIQYTHDHAHTMHREYMHVHVAICMLHTFGLETSKVPMVTLLELEPSLRARCVKAGWRRSESRTPGPDSDRGDHPAVKGQYKAVIFSENVWKCFLCEFYSMNSKLI